MTLTHNASGRYEDRWVRLQVNPKASTPFLKGITSMEVPVRHGEGRLIIKGTDTLAAIEERGLNCLTYTDFDGSPTDVYPHNPNGADLNCAGLTDTTGRVFGLMPHPEAFLSLYNHPDWARRKRVDAAISEEGDGLWLFRNIVEHVAALRGGPFSLPTPSPKGRGSLTTVTATREGKVFVVEEPERGVSDGPGAYFYDYCSEVESPGSFGAGKPQATHGSGGQTVGTSYAAKNWAFNSGASMPSTPT